MKGHFWIDLDILFLGKLIKTIARNEKIFELQIFSFSPLVTTDWADSQSEGKPAGETVSFRCSRLEMLDLLSTFRQARHRVKNFSDN